MDEMKLTLITKLASIVVHADEMMGPAGHNVDRVALKGLVEDAEVQEWIKSLGPLAPVKR